MRRTALALSLCYMVFVPEALSFSGSELQRLRLPLGLNSSPSEDLITSIFKRWLPTPTSVGLTQFTKDTLPEKFPATLTEVAEILPSDNDETKKLIRPLLKQTNLECRPLILAYDAQRDGWSANSFHSKVDKKGPSLVLCQTSDGVFGGYNPCGWVNLGESRGGIAAFLFYFPNGDTKQRPVKLQKIGGASMAQVDDGGGPRFGMEGLYIPLGALGRMTSSKAVLSKLGLYYQNCPNGQRSLLPRGAPTAELSDLRVFCGDFGSDPVPYRDAMFFQLN